MDRQRSFSSSFKPTRLLFLSFAASSSAFLCFLFYCWVLSSSSPSSAQSRPLLGGAKGDAGFLPLRSGFWESEPTTIAAVATAGASSVVVVLDAVPEKKKKKNSTLVSENWLNNGTVGSSPAGGVDSTSKNRETVPDDARATENGNRSSEDTHFWDLGAGYGGSDSFEEGDSGADEIEVKLDDSFQDEAEGDIDSGSATGDAPQIDSVDVAGEAGNRPNGSCDVSVGSWVRDDSYPLYTNRSCPFIDEGFHCQSNGRPDGDYMKWRWQPTDCNIPRFDAVKMLELIRGKRLVFVGDSLNRNQWESMLCVLKEGVSDPSKVYEARGRKITKEKGNYSFKFVDYQCSVEYYVTHFLVREGKARVGRKRVPTLRIDAIDRGSSRWKSADILVFNTAHWWSHYKTKAGKNYYQEGDQVHPQLDVQTAFRRALLTWASWVDRHIDQRKTHVFFRSSAPSHFSGGEWNSGGHCTESTQPLNQTFGSSLPEKNVIVEQVLRQMKTPVTFLNISTLSGLRIDGHPSVYGTSPAGRGSQRSGQDCSHWCLPGVPDTWNELLYSYLLSKQKKEFSS